ncbi:MAG: hypothetical protein ACLTDX_12890 [[Clostridium] innocuum]
MNETRKMGMEIRILTLLLCAAGCVVCIILFPGAWKQGVMGILIGSLTGIMGFNMIQNMVGHIDGELADIKSRAFRSYTRRYMLYAVIFALSAIAGAHIAALLVGMLLHKCSILIFSWKHRKEDE